MKRDRDGRAHIAVSFGKGELDRSMLYAVPRLQAKKQGERSRIALKLRHCASKMNLKLRKAQHRSKNLGRSLNGFPETPAYAAVALE